MKNLLILAYVAIFCILPGHAFAYIGPGIATSAFAAVAGVIVALFVGLFAVVYYPIKRVIKKLRKSNKTKTTDATDVDQTTLGQK